MLYFGKSPYADDKNVYRSAAGWDILYTLSISSFYMIQLCESAIVLPTDTVMGE